VQNIRKVGGAAAPSGLPVASTASVNISTSPFQNYNPYTKKLSGYGFNVLGVYSLSVDSGLIYMNTVEDGNNFVLISPNTILSGGLSYTPSTWKITQFGDDDGFPFFSESATNPSTDPTTIPTSGWSPSITITAA